MTSKVSTVVVMMSLALSACTGGTSDPIRQHESGPSALSPSKPALPTISADKRASVEEAQQIQRLKTQELTSENQRYFLKFENWENESLSLTTEFKDFIHHFQRQAVADYKKLDSSAYKKLFLQFCNEDMNQCKHLPTLKSTPYTATLLTRLAQNETDLKTRMRLTLLSLEIGNKLPNQEASVLLLNDLKALRTELGKNGKASLLLQIESYVDLIYLNARAGLLQISPEELSAAIDLLAAGEDSQLELAGRLMVRESKNTTQLAAKIEALNAKPVSYARKFEWMEKNSPHFVQQLKVQKLDFDGYYFILEQILQRNWTSKQAAAFFRGSGLNLKTLSEKSEIYANNVVAFIIAAIHSDLLSSFKKDDQKQSRRFFYDGGVAISPRLVEARALVDQFRSLINLEDTLGSQGQTGLRRIVESLPETFRVAVSYPVTLALLDRGIQMGVEPSDPLDILGSSYSGYISFTEVFLGTLAGNIEPLVQVLPVGAPRQYFIFHESLEFALRANFFGMSPDAGDQALERIMNFYMQVDTMKLMGMQSREVIETRLSLTQQAVQLLHKIRGSSLFRFAQTQCVTIVQSGIESTVDLAELQGSPSLGDRYKLLKDSGETSTGSTDLKDTQRIIHYALFPADARNADALEWMRLDVIPRIEQFLAIAKAVESDTDLRFPKFQKMMGEIKALIAELYVLQTEQIRDYLPCWYKIMNHERNLTAQIVKYDHVFWQWAVQPANRDKMTAIFSKDLPDEIKYRSQFQGNSILIYNFDLNLRARYYMKYGLPFLAKPMPPLAPRIRVQVNPGFAKEHRYRTSTMTPVTIEGSLENTALMALRSSGFKQETSSVFWFLSSFMPSEVFSRLLEVNTTLYRMGTFAKEFLGVQSPYSTDEMMKDNRDLFQFLNLTPVEAEVMNLLGVHRRFNSPGRVETPYIYTDEKTFLPITETLNKYMISPWLGTLGNPAIWENPKDNHGQVRPFSMIPLQALAKTYRSYNFEQSQGISHLFKSNLKSPSAIDGFMKKFFRSDIEARKAIVERIKTAPDFTYHIKVDEMITAPASNPFLVDDLRNTIADFEQYID